MPTKVIRSDIDAGAYSITSEKMWLEWVYKVAGNFTEMSCLDAVDDTTGLAVPKVDSTHLQNPDLICTEVTPRRVDYSPAYGPVHEVTVRWETSIVTGTFDPLAPNAEYQWDFEEESVTLDHDLQGRAFVNTAYDPILGGYQMTRQIPVLKVWRLEPVFDVTLAYNTQGRVNGNDIVVLGKTVPKESMILWSYRNSQPLRVGQTGPVRTELIFKFKEPISANDKPWQAQFSNVGFNGFAASGVLGPFRPQGSKDAITEPIPLDVDGKPLYGTYKIGSSSPIAVSASDFAAFATPGFPETLLSDTDPKFYKLLFDVRYTYNFQNFIQGIM